jgi:Domain of unknown function (DUF4372)
MRPSGRKDVAMHQGHCVFAQLMQHLPLTTFRRSVARYDGERRVKRFSCLDQYLCLAFAQLTWRESLRDIEACLRAQSSKLYHLGFRSAIALVISLGMIMRQIVVHRPPQGSFAKGNNLRQTLGLD